MIAKSWYGAFAALDSGDIEPFTELLDRDANWVAIPQGGDPAETPALTREGPTEPADELEPGFFLCVSRLLAYKNVDAVVAGFAKLPDERLVVAGARPQEAALRRAAGANVTIFGRVDDAHLRWLYRECRGLVAASHEDFGLTPLEAATFGKPSAVLRLGGFLDTVAEGESGIFFESSTPRAVADAVREPSAGTWEKRSILAHAARFSEARFIERIREIAGAG
jgi:glycosyltransferase involved in cell wall biosynthesis